PGQALAPIGLERAADVGDRVADHGAPRGVGDPRRYALEPRVMAPNADPRHDVGLLESAEDARQIGGIVLEVGIERHDDVAARAREAGRERGALPPALG